MKTFAFAGASRWTMGLDRLPDHLRRYTIAAVVFVGTMTLAEILLRTVGTKPALVYTLLFDLLIMGSAWLGYGPGLLVCGLTTYLAPHVLLPNRPSTHVDLGKFALLVLISFLISRISQSKRRSEASLRRVAEQLEIRVAERTLELQRNEQMLREHADLLDLAQDGILATDHDGVIRYWNRGAERMYGWTSEEAICRDATDLIPTILPEPTEAIRAKLLTDGFWHGEQKQTTRDGSQLAVMSRWALRRGVDGSPTTILEINTDVTERRLVEERLRHTQKMESVGLLAGGVAHDFNNLLTVINGYAEMLTAEVMPDSSFHDGLAEIRAAGERAAGLTQQLLAFSRKQLIQPSVVNLNDIVTDVQKMLRRLIGEDIALVTNLSPTLANTLADAGQLQQIIVNLAVNARDAMAGGGTLIFETADVLFDESYKESHPEVQVGASVMLAVTDSGTGMTPEVQDHLFEPFFTTKPKGSGTGLGLATVYGMVKQSGGWIWVYSEPGNGTTFKIYFPRTEAPRAELKVVPRNDPAGNETVLIVEDQAEVRSLAAAALRLFGYTVLDAANGDEALAVCESFGGVIHLLLTDVIMPGMSGRELADLMVVRRPNMKTLFVSGYTEAAISHRGVLDGNVAYLQKPFTPRSLGTKVREVLGPREVTPTIMIIDDDPAVRRILSSILTGAGFAVIEAENGRQALARLPTECTVDIVVSDLVMPEQEGLETILLLRKRYPAIGIIAISGAFGGGFLDTAVKFGAHAALPKPIDAARLLEAVKGALQIAHSAEKPDRLAHLVTCSPRHEPIGVCDGSI